MSARHFSSLKNAVKHGRFVSNTITLGLVLTLAAGPSAAFAKKRAHHRKPASKKAARVDSDSFLKQGDSGSIIDLQEELYSVYKNKTATKLRHAYDALDKKHYESAKSLAAPLLNDARFGDYARWISARASIRQAQLAEHTEKFAQTKKNAMDAITALTPIPAKFPYSPFLRSYGHQISSAETLLGRAECASKKWLSCQTAYENALERVVSTPDMAYLSPEDLSTYAKACAQKKSESCISWTQRLAAYYSKSTEEFKAIANVFPEYRDETPRPTFPGRLTAPYRGADMDQSAMDQAMQTYLDGKNRDAIVAFQKFIDEFPRSSARFRAKYWLAQALKKSSKDDEAKKVLTDLQKSSPLTYYGLLAAIDLGTTPQSILDPDPPGATDFDPFLQPLEVYKLRRAQNLLAAKAYDLAAIELREFKARDAHSNEFLVYLAMLHTEARSWVTAFTILNELIARGHTAVFSQYFEKVIFPTDPITQIKKFADDVRIDPVLVASLLKQESSFDSTATSVSGALGLMQLMPTTAVDTIAGTARYQLLDSETNLKTGTLYLSKLLSKFQGNIVYATASYNAGPGAVNRWIKASPAGRPMLEFIEAIPYKETREYVMAIIRNYYWYTHRLNPDAATKLKLDFFWHNYGPSVSLMSDMSRDPAPASVEASPTVVPSLTVTSSPTQSVMPTPAPTPTSTPLASPSISVD